MDGRMRQKEQSKQMIETALFALLDEKAYAQITVSEIVSRADVARRTFYRMYNNKEGIIKNYFERLCSEYQNRYPQLESYDLCVIARDYFGFWYRQRDYLLKMHKQGLDDALCYGINSASMAVIGGRISDRELRESPEMEYFAAYSVGGFINLLLKWIEKEMDGTPEQYAETVSGAILRIQKEAQLWN